MQFAILGPLEVRHDDEPVAIPGAKQRVLLAALLVAGGEVVSRDRLAEILWGDDQPANPRNALQSQVSQLRRLLGPDGRDIVVSHHTGYAFGAPPASVDADRFETTVRAGRQALAAGDHLEAAGLLRSGLALWRGPALAEFTDQDFAAAPASRLDELRLGAIEDRVDADLATGSHADLVPELERLVADHPLRERLRGQLMLALYRAGRQADALQVYHDTREVLDEELGLDPSPALTQRYEQLLRHEDEPPRPTSPTTAEPRGTPAVATSVSPGRDADHQAGTIPSAAPALPPVPPPAPLSSFVGRDDELVRVLDLLRSARLVTLTGPGGVGKTRLATEAVLAIADDPIVRDGVWYVELAAVSDPTLVADEVAATLGLHEESSAVPTGLGGQRDAAARVADALRHRSGILVLDNCEHLVDAAASLARELLAAAPDLTVLCTTREALGVTGETVWSVPSLATPPAAANGAGESLRSGAPRLFVDRARGLDPTFDVDDAEARTIVEICRKLDGIPLALELAAARVRTLGLDELAVRLDDRFRVLTGGDRTAQARQRTLRAVVEWSWDLLDQAERTLFRRMSVFAAGASLDAIEAVCCDDAFPVDAVLDVVAALVDKSVITLDTSHRPPRYRMLETLRAFGEEQLTEAGETETVRDRHADRILTVTTTESPRLRGRDQLAAMRIMDAAQPDVRAALHWLEVSGDLDRGARLAAELGWYWYLKGTRGEASRWLSAFADAADPRDRALTATWRAFLALGFGPTEELRSEITAAAEVLLQHGGDEDIAMSQLVAADLAAVLGETELEEHHLALARDAAARAGDDGYAATADFVVGHGHVANGRFREAAPWMEAAYERFREVGDRWGQVQCLMALVGVAEALGDIDTAVERGRRGIALAVELGLREMEAVLHARIGMFHALSGAFDDAWRSIERVEVVADELGSELLAANVDLASSIVALRADELDAAERSLLQLLDRLDRLPHGSVRAETLTRLGIVAERRGALADARVRHGQALEVALRFPEPRSTAFVLEAAAATLAADGAAEDAARFLGAADAQRRSVGLPLPDPERAEVERAEERCREHLDDAAFDTAFDRGAESELPSLLAVFDEPQHRLPH